MTTSGTTLSGGVLTPVRVVGDTVRAAGSFFALTLDTFVVMVTKPLAWREFITQTWFLARVSWLPAVALAFAFISFTTFNFNHLLGALGLSDLAGAVSALGNTTQSAMVVTVFVVSGAGATAMCADLGARTIREELDAMRVMGINPVQALVVPRVLASGLVGLMLVSLVIVIGLIGGFIVSVFLQHVSPGAYVGLLALSTGLQDVLSSMVKALMSGFVGGLIACYKGMAVAGGPRGVGDAVNETVIYAFVVLFVVNVIITGVVVVVWPA